MLSSRRELPKQVPTFLPPQREPLVWITYFEENQKFGMAYLLNSNVVGMKFNDSTSIVSNNQFLKMKYIDLQGKSEKERKIE
jgi:hypothetical protein